MASEVPPLVQFQLSTPARPIRGKIVDLEGLPLSSANVRVERILKLGPYPKMDEWIPQARKQAATEERNRPRVSNSGLHLPYNKGLSRIDDVELFKNVRVSPDGTFELLPGFAADQVLELKVSGERLESTTVRVFARDMKPLTAGHQYYGHDFVLPMKPGRRIEGVVIDAETERPISGVVISTRSSAMKGESVTSDEAGKFVLGSQPKDERVFLVATVVDSEKHFSSSAILPPASDADREQPLRIKLSRGIPIQGRVIDSETGAPVEARITYMPVDYEVATSPDKTMIRPHSRSSKTTNIDGTFSIPAIQGKGYLAVRAKQSEWYRQGEGFENGEHRFMRSGEYNKRIVIDVDALKNPEHKVALTRYATHEITLLDSAGRGLTGVQAVGIGPVKVTGNTVRIHEANNNDKRHLMLMHPEKRLGALVIYRPLNPPKSVRLRRLARIEGKLPSAFSHQNTRVELRKPASRRDPPFSDLPPGPPFMLTRAQPDKNGRFIFDVPPGANYEIAATDTKNDIKAREMVNEPRPGETRNVQTLDLVPYRTSGGVL